MGIEAAETKIRKKKRAVKDPEDKGNTLKKRKLDVPGGKEKAKTRTKLPVLSTTKKKSGEKRAKQKADALANPTTNEASEKSDSVGTQRTMDYKLFHLKKMKKKWKSAKVKRIREKTAGKTVTLAKPERSKLKKDNKRETENFGCCDLNEFLHYWNEYTASKLTAIERKEIQLEPQNVITNTKGRGPCVFFKKRIPDWKEWLKEEIPNGSPLMIVVSPSQLRAVELNRALTRFKGTKCRTAKLIRKEKAKDQAEFLTNKVAHMALGTPHRIQLLLSHETLKLDACRVIALDWSFEDKKKRRLITIPEVRLDLLRLFHKHLIPLLNKKDVSLLLF